MSLKYEPSLAPRSSSNNNYFAKHNGLGTCLVQTLRRAGTDLGRASDVTF